MRSKYYIGSIIVLFLIILLGIIGFNYKYNNFENSKKEEEIVNNFEITSKRINCEAIKLKVYSDNTFKVIYGYEKDDMEKVNIGVYSYDITKIVSNNHKYEKNEHGIYSLVAQNGKVYEIYDTNEDLNKFLKEIDVNLDTCLELNY